MSIAVRLSLAPPDVSVRKWSYKLLASPIDKTFGNLTSASDERAAIKRPRVRDLAAHSKNTEFGIGQLFEKPTNPLDLCQGLGRDLSFCSQRT